RSCAADLGTLARADLHLRRLKRIVRRDRAIVKFPIKGGRLFLYNNNPLIRGGYRGVTGLKTGYTDRAGHSIVATAKRGRVELRDRQQRFGGAQDPLADDRVLAHERPFLVGQGARLVQDLVGDRHLPHVVQLGGAYKLVELLDAELQARADAEGELRDSLQVI